MLVENQMPQLMSEVEPAPLTGLLSVQECERRTVLPKREGIDRGRLYIEREDADALRLHEMDDVPDWPLAETPLGSEFSRGSFRLHLTGIWKRGRREGKPLVDPTTQLKSQLSGTQGCVLLRSRHP
jgi:hypothetical protein